MMRLSMKGVNLGGILYDIHPKRGKGFEQIVQGFSGVKGESIRGDPKVSAELEGK